MNPYKNFLFLMFLFLLPACKVQDTSTMFSGENAYEHIKAQLDFGPRIPGSEGLENTADYIKSTLESNGWDVSFQDFIFMDVPVRNIIAKKGSGSQLIMLGTHYDTRSVSDQDTDTGLRDQPVPGANDGGSGTAVLLEFGRVLEVPLEKEVWLLFFDAEDQGHLNGWQWSIGADYFVVNLQNHPDKVVIIDMIGDKDLNVYQEMNSSSALTHEIWESVTELGLQTQFIPEEKYAMIDDHLPFINHGYQAALLIDFDYPAWHTTGDTIDKVSPESLKMMGDILLHWLTQ